MTRNCFVKTDFQNFVRQPPTKLQSLPQIVLPHKADCLVVPLRFNSILDGSLYPKVFWVVKDDFAAAVADAAEPLTFSVELVSRFQEGTQVNLPD